MLIIVQLLGDASYSMSDCVYIRIHIPVSSNASAKLKQEHERRCLFSLVRQLRSSIRSQFISDYAASQIGTLRAAFQRRVHYVEAGGSVCEGLGS